MTPGEVSDLLESSGQAFASTLNALSPSVEDLLHEWVHHDGNHLRQAIGNVQAYVWPNIGNARRFTRPEQ